MQELDSPQGVNLLPADPDRAARRHTIILAAVFTVVVAVVAAIGAGASYRAASQGITPLDAMTHWPFFSGFQKIVGQTASSTAATVKTPSDRLNILVLGIGGEGHDGSLLTDTMLLASIDLKDKKVGLISIPRDLAYPLGEGKFEKINAVNAYEEMAHPGEGAKRTAELLGSLFNINIDHVVRLDFNGFEALINALDGIDINVERAFTDNTYPLDDALGTVTTVSFKKGMQHMDGAHALIFTRSRHGSAGEGSDFARSRRQQLVMLAVKNKLLSLGTLADPTKLASIYKVVNDHLQSDLSIWDWIKLAPLAENFSADKIVMHVPDDGPNGLLVAGNVDGSFMLFPRKPDWSELRDLVQNPFTTAEDLAVAQKPQTHTILEVHNGTTRTGFASQVAAKLEKEGYEINNFGNATRRGYERTVIYDLTQGKKPQELSQLKRKFTADISAVDPKAIKPLDGSQIRTFPIDSRTSEKIFGTDTDFLIILGESSYAVNY